MCQPVGSIAQHPVKMSSVPFNRTVIVAQSLLNLCVCSFNELSTFEQRQIVQLTSVMRLELLRYSTLADVVRFREEQLVGHSKGKFPNETPFRFEGYLPRKSARARSSQRLLRRMQGTEN